MKKYWYIARNTWDQTFAYRISFVIWRLRSILQVLTLYFLWLVMLPRNATFGGYNQSLMLTYILGTSLINSIVFSSKTFAIADEINEGTLSAYLLRPMNYFSYIFVRDLGDKALNVIFSFVELAILFFLLRPPFFIQTNPMYLTLFLLSVVLSVALYFLFSVLLGFMGFWSRDTWGPRFIFMQLLTFFAGGLFPLDLLPRPVYIVAEALPFTYLLYFPIKIYLGQLSFLQLAQGLFISGVWVLSMYGVVTFVWRRGLRTYAAEGS